MNAAAHLPIPPSGSSKDASSLSGAATYRSYLPDEVRSIGLEQTTIPAIAKDPALLDKIESVRTDMVPTKARSAYMGTRETCPCNGEFGASGGYFASILDAKAV